MMNQSSQVKNIFDIAQRAMNAQMTRMNTIASNLANANTVASSEEEAFRPMRPIFETKFLRKFQQRRCGDNRRCQNCRIGTPRGTKI